MFDMLLWFAVVMVLFAVGDVVAKLTKARISSVFATLMLFLILFVAGVLPADIIEKAEAAMDQKKAEELEQKLRSWEAGEEEAAAIADRMEELGFLNDAAYAAQVVRYYSAKGYGERKLRDELYRRGIPRELWDEALEGAADPSAAIEEFLRKKWRGTLPDDPRELKKASDALARRGYSWSDIVEGLRRYGAEAESDE